MVSDIGTKKIVKNERLEQKEHCLSCQSNLFHLKDSIENWHHIMQTPHRFKNPPSLKGRG